jgi:hypothetical protein
MHVGGLFCDLVKAFNCVIKKYLFYRTTEEHLEHVNILSTHRILSCKSFSSRSLHHMNTTLACHYCRHCKTQSRHVRACPSCTAIEFSISRCIVCCNNLKYFTIFLPTLIQVLLTSNSKKKLFLIIT